MSEGPTVFHPVGAEVTDKSVAMSVIALPGGRNYRMLTET